MKLVYRINNTRLAFQTSKTRIYRPKTSKLKSISKFQLLFHLKKFEKYMIFHTLSWNHVKRNSCVVPFAIAKLGQMSWSSTHTKKWTRQQLHHCTQRLNHVDILMLCFKTLLAAKKDALALCEPWAMSLTVICQNRIGFYASTHSTFNLIGPCNKHPNMHSHKATKIHTLIPLTYELFCT